MLYCINTRAIYSELNTRARALTMHCNAQDNVSQYPEATKAVLENLYMDNYLDLVELTEKALKRSEEFVHLFHLGGLKLTKFVSNVLNLADRIDGSPQSNEPKVIARHILGGIFAHAWVEM